MTTSSLLLFQLYKCRLVCVSVLVSFNLNVCKMDYYRCTVTFLKNKLNVSVILLNTCSCVWSRPFPLKTMQNELLTDVHQVQGAAFLHQKFLHTALPSHPRVPYPYLSVC